jgi:uncharacterized protein (TIGR03083 family)
VRGPLGAELTLEEAMRYRAFDIWVHEQDLRTALGRPGNLDSPGAHVARDYLLDALPGVVAERTDAPRSSAIVFDVHGPVEFLRTVRIDIQGRATLETAPALGPAAALSLDWETYVRLACGRVSPEAVADRVKTEGDTDLAAAILRNFTVTQ